MTTQFSSPFPVIVYEKDLINQRLALISALTTPWLLIPYKFLTEEELAQLSDCKEVHA